MRIHDIAYTQRATAQTARGLFNSFSRIIQRQISNKKTMPNAQSHKMMVAAAAATIAATAATTATTEAATAKKLFVAVRYLRCCCCCCCISYVAR